jgi:hypothetical protein
MIGTEGGFVDYFRLACEISQINAASTAIATIHSRIARQPGNRDSSIALPQQGQHSSPRSISAPQL